MRRFCVVALGAMLACVAVAQQAPAAPIVLFARVSSGTGGGGGGGGGTYTCATAIAGTSGVSCPTAPTTSSNATVNPSTLAANKVNGRDLTLQNGSYGDQTFTTTDQIIRIQGSGSIDSLTLDSGAARLKFVCETARACTIRYITFIGAVSDISFEDITITSPALSDQGQIWYATLGTGQLNRHAFINVNMDTDGWCAFAEKVTDLVFGNSKLNGNGDHRHCLRFHGVLDSVVADSEISIDGSGVWSYRVHAEGSEVSGNNYLLRSSIIDRSLNVSADSGSGGGGTMGEQFIESNCVYSAGSWDIVTGSGSNRATVGHVKNNAGYGSITWPSAGAFQSDDISGNTVSAYTTPPTFTYDGTACS